MAVDARGNPDGGGSFPALAARFAETVLTVARERVEGNAFHEGE